MNVGKVLPPLPFKVFEIEGIRFFVHDGHDSQFFLWFCHFPFSAVEKLWRGEVCRRRISAKELMRFGSSF